MGGRGIKVCKKWIDSFDEFTKDLGLRPKGMQLDRIDNDKNYTPENCKWSTPSENARNRRSSRRILFKGESYGLHEFSEKIGMKYSVLTNRLNLGWSIDRIVNQPVRRSPNRRK
jgi:hypothetical protein